MPKRIKPLNETQVRTAKPRESDYKLFDGGGLFLLITKTGGKLWRLKYTFDGKEKLSALGAYPEISLNQARKRREDARSQLADGTDPAEVKKAQKAAQVEQKNTFEVVARLWFAKMETDWSQGHAETVKSRLERDVFPAIGDRPITEIRTSELRMMLENINARGVRETAYRIKVILGQVFRYAMAREIVENDPSASLKPREILGKATKRNFAAITEPKLLPPLLRAIDAYEGTMIVRCALRLAPLVFVRPGELRKARWDMIDFETAQWSFQASKGDKPHIVPLSRQALAILRELRPLTGHCHYVFPGRTNGRPISENTINAALRYMGYDKNIMTGHGFRAMARTILDEVLDIRPDFIEHQLAHVVKDANGVAYNRTKFLPQRRDMLQKWADYLDGLKQRAKIISLQQTEKL